MTGRVDHLEDMLARHGLGLATWSPGDGWTRYRITASPDSDYFSGDGLYTGTIKEVEAYACGVIDGYAVGRKEGIR